MNAPINTTNNTGLLKSRNKAVAKSFYRQLKTEGFSTKQIIELSATLIDLVNKDLQDAPRQ